MKDSIKATDLTRDRFVKFMKTSAIHIAYIGDRDALTIAVASDPLSYYFALEEESFLLMDNYAIAISKGSYLKKHFDYM